MGVAEELDDGGGCTGKVGAVLFLAYALGARLWEIVTPPYRN